MRNHYEQVSITILMLCSSQLSFVGLLGSMFSSPKKTSHEFLEKMVATGKPLDELANAILSVAVVATVELSQGQSCFSVLKCILIFLFCSQR